LTERASAEADVAGEGQFWVKSDTPNTPYFTDDAGNDIPLKAVGVKRKTLLPASDLSLLTSGVAPTQITKAFSSESRVAYRYSASAFQSANFLWVPPPSWDGDTIRYRIIWAPSTTAAGNINFNCIPYYAADGETVAIPSAIGGVTDTSQGATDVLHVSPWSAWLSVPFSAGDVVFMRFYGRGGSADWTTTAAADVIAIELEWTTNAPTDD
jgi:hypothetical protein